VNPLGITVSTATGQLRITGVGTYTFGNNAAQPITLNGGNPTAGALSSAVTATVVNPILVSANSAISVDTGGGSTILTLNGIISGSGNLQKRGNRTLQLSASNTLTGAIDVQGGELRLSNLNAISSASGVTVGAGATLQLNLTGDNSWPLGTGNIILNNGGTLRQFSGAETDIARISQTIQLTGSGGTINAPGDSRIYVSGDISGTHLSKSGGGELRFEGTPKTYTGTTTISNGRIRIESSGIPTATSAINLTGGNLRFGESSPQTYSLGAGGAAPITISSSSIEYTDVSTATLTNSIAVNATGGNFRSREAGSVLQLTGALTGAGALTINTGSGGNPVQSGTIFLRGNASAFGGNVNVVQSTLRLAGATTLGANAFSVQAPATLQIDINSPLQFGRVVATGSATLLAGSVILPNFTVNPASGISTYDIVTASGGVTNGAVVTSTSINQMSLSVVGANILRLTSNVNFAGFGVTGFTPIQMAVADYLNTAVGGSELSAVQAQALNAPSNAVLAAYYDAIAAEEVGGLIDSALFHSQDQLRSITRFAPHLQNRLNLAGTLGVQAASGATVGGSDEDWNLFSDLRVQRGSRIATAELGGYEDSAQNFILGADRQFSDIFAGGFFGTYEHGRTSFDQGRGFADADTLAFGAMGSFLFPKGHLTAGFEYFDHSFDLERNSADGTAHSAPEGDQVGLILQGGTQLGQGRLSVMPTAHLQYHHLWLDGFSESGAAISQTFDDTTADSLQAGVGLRIGYTIPGRVVSLRPEIFAEYRHELLDGDRAISSNLLNTTGGLDFVTPGREAGYAVVGGGLHAAFNDNTSAFVQYEAQLIDSDAATYGIYGGFRWDFSESPFTESALSFSDSTRNYRETLRGSMLGDAINAINLRALINLQYDNAQTQAKPGTDPDPVDPTDTDFWHARRIRLSAERDLGWGLNAAASFQFSEELVSSESAVELFETNVTWDLYEPFTLKFGLDKVPLGYEETTSSARIKTIERSVASRAFGRQGGDQIARSHWRGAAEGTFKDLYTSDSGLIRGYDFHYEFAVANPREDVEALWDDNGTGSLWGESSYYLRLSNEVHTSIGQFDMGIDLADIPSFRARSDNAVTGAKAYSPFVNYSRGWFNLTATGYLADYDRDAANGGAAVEAEGITITPSLFITPKVELVAMYSNFDTDGDFAIRANQAAANIPTTFPDNRRFDHVEQFYFGINHYLDGDDLKVMYGIEHTTSDGTRADRAVSEEEALAFRVRFQLRL